MLTSANYKQDINNPKLQLGQKINRVLVDEEYVIKQKKSEYYYGLDIVREFVELHFYIPDTETLIYSTAVPLSEGYVAVTRDNLDESGNFVDGNFKLELYIWTPGPERNDKNDPNYWFNEESLQQKYLEGLPSGYYDVAINFFADEVGTYEDIDWRIKTISPSKTEVVLHANPQQDGSGEVNFSPREFRDYEQFLYTSIFYNEFVGLIQKYFGDNDILYNDVIRGLNQKQLDKAQSNIVDFPQYILELLQHTGYDISDWMRSEISSDNPGGSRWRIQQDRFNGALETILSSITQEHLRSINTNDSGPVPFIVNQ